MLAGLLMLKTQRNLPGQESDLQHQRGEFNTLVDRWMNTRLKTGIEIGLCWGKGNVFHHTFRSTDCELLTSNTGITTFVISVMVGAIQSQKSFRLWRKRRYFLFLFFLLSFWWECLSPPPLRKEYWWKKVHGNDNNDDTMMLMMMMMMMMMVVVVVVVVVVLVKKMTMTKNPRKDA